MVKITRSIPSPLSENSGFSIVELMVAILIALIILAGVVQVVLTSRTTFFAQEDMSYIQENARYALDVLGKDIQSSGYWGCAGAGATMALVATVTDADEDLPANSEIGSHLFIGPEPLIGFEGDAETTGEYYKTPEKFKDDIRVINGSANKPDSIITRRFAGTPVSVTGHVNNTQTLSFEPAHTFKAGNYIGIVAEDCQRVGVIRASEVDTDTNTVKYTGTVCGTKIKPNLLKPVNCSTLADSLIEAYLPGSVAMEYVSHAYYVADSSAYSSPTNDPAVKQPALKRMVLRNGEGQEEEVALGVEDLQILYGVATSGTQVTQYFKANEITSAAQWARVVSVQVSLLFRAQTKSLPQSQQAVYLDRTYNDSYMRQVVTATYRIRNRI